MVRKGFFHAAPSIQMLQKYSTLGIDSNYPRHESTTTVAIMVEPKPRTTAGWMIHSVHRRTYDASNGKSTVVEFGHLHDHFLPHAH
ncbi:hypothetical protein AB1N83_005923 [Pleurotus pulmonarius]